jgi:predicted ATPase/DNA-binding SARP family transcriptional activator
MRFGVLGSLEVWTTGSRSVTIPERKVRAVLADLLVNRGTPVSADRLIDDLWGDRPPANPARVLRSKISQLRAVLEAAEPGGRDLVVRRQPGYLLQVRPSTVDADDFEALLARAYQSRDPRIRATLLSDALALWRGPALADFADEEFVRSWASGLEERRLAALEELVELRLERGEHALLVGELADLVERYPSRERFRSVQLRALYRAGRQGEALAAYHELSRHLRDTLGIEPSPELAALHLAMLHHDPALAAPAGPPRPPTNLPTPVTALVGREEAVSDTCALLQDHRVVTLLGPGGVGKTRLALEVSRRLSDQFPDGLWFVELAALEAPDGAPSPHAAGQSPAGEALARVTQLVAGVLGLRDEGPPGVVLGHGGPSALDRLATVLSGRRVLLVLDNCEHLVEAAAELGKRLLHAAGDVRILATSREPLGIFGERLQTVRPLTFPAATAAAGLSATELASYSAIELFVARATATAPDFALDAERAALVAAICQRLDGIPLALELAATRVRSLGVHQLAARLDDRFRVLASGERGAPLRQRTLQGMIDWSWELLGDQERVVLRRLAVHAGGCTAEAAEAVCSAAGVLPDEVLDTLSRLVDRSLVVMVDEPDGVRYRLLESVLAYGLERLREAGEIDQVRDRHSRYFLDFAEQADPQLRGHDQRRWLRRLDAETANLHSALDHAIRQGDAGLALRLTCAQSWYWVLRGRLNEGSAALARALDIPDPEPGTLRLTAETWHSAISALAGREPDPVRRLRGELADPRGQGGDPYGLIRAQGLLAVVTPRASDPAAGVDLVNRSLSISRALGYRWGIAAALSTRAWDALMRNEFDALRRDAEESLALFRELGDQWGVLHATDPLAAMARIQGDLATAGRLNLQGMQVAQDLGLLPKLAYLLCERGQIAMLTGDYRDAEDAFERARQLAIEQSNPFVEQTAALGLARNARRRGDWELARKWLLPWLEWNRQVGWDAGTAAVLAELALVAEGSGDRAACLALRKEGYLRARAAGEPRVLALAMEGLAGAHALDGNHARAARLLGAAEVVRARCDLPLPDAEREHVERVSATVAAVLGPDIFALELERGRQGDPEEDGPAHQPVATPVAVSRR